MLLFILYLIKVNIALVVLYLFYKLSFSKDTFFGMRRIMLILIYVTAFAYPFFGDFGWVDFNRNIFDQGINTLYYAKYLPEITIFNEEALESSMYLWLGSLGIGLYFMGFLFLLVRTVLEICKTCYTLQHYPKLCINGVRVCITDIKEEPYSFFRWICLYPSLYNDREIVEILRHEQTHVSECHSIDILFSQFLIILCWFNPFAWLIRSEMRVNHEYIADRKVIASGCDKKAYQYHLLGLEHSTQAAANLYNNFSVLPLKNRIKMLNRKRTQNIMLSKYLMYFPVVALLMLFSNCTNSTNEAASDLQDLKTEAKAVPIEVKADDQEVLDMVEEMPDFPGGSQALMEYLKTNIKYPKDAEKAGTQGRVIVQFVVNKDGTIADAKVLRKVDESLDKEALRVINGMPKWTPGKQKGVPVRVKYTIPVMFKLK